MNVSQRCYSCHKGHSQDFLLSYFWEIFSQSRMNFSISYTCVLKLRSLINDYNPGLGFEEFARDVKEGIKFTKLVSQRNYLEKLVKRGEATPEVISLARRRYSTENHNKRYKAEEKRIMMFRIREKNTNLHKKKKEWTERSKACEAVFPRDGKEKYRALKLGPSPKGPIKPHLCKAKNTLLDQWM